MDRVRANQVRTTLPDKPDLLFQITRKPNVICIKERNQLALGRANSGVTGHTRAAIFLLEILNAIKIGPKHALKLFSIRRAVVDDDGFKIFIGLRKDRIQHLADEGPNTVGGNDNAALGQTFSVHAAVCFGSRGRGGAADTPVNQLSNSIGDNAETSTSRGNSKGLEFCDAKPNSQVVAESTPASFSHGRNARSQTPLG